MLELEHFQERIVTEILKKNRNRYFSLVNQSRQNIEFTFNSAIKGVDILYSKYQYAIFMWDLLRNKYSF